MDVARRKLLVVLPVPAYAIHPVAPIRGKFGGDQRGIHMVSCTHVGVVSIGHGVLPLGTKARSCSVGGRYDWVPRAMWIHHLGEYHQKVGRLCGERFTVLSKRPRADQPCQLFEL